MSNEKPMSTKVRDMVLRIMERAMYYNNAPTCRERTGDKPTFFVSLSGHCGIISVQCYPHGYSKGGDAEWCGGECTFDLCESEYIAEEKIENNLRRILRDMDYHYNGWIIRQEAAPNE